MLSSYLTRPTRRKEQLWYFSLTSACTGADADSAGLIPRALKDLFSKTVQLGGEENRQHCRICMTYVEIYNERLHDLLQPYKPNARVDPQVNCEMLT